MNVENIRLINFRNYKSININFNNNVNVFVGKNAQGKTNLLEAIYMCSTGKSFRTNKDKEIIKFDKDEAYIGSRIVIGRFDKFLEIKMDRQRSKIIRIDKTEIKNYKELYTGLNVVVFSPDDLKLVKEGPSERRSFLDIGISQLKPIYSYNINRYNKILFQRNNLLKSTKLRKELINLLEVFDVQIAKLGTSIILERDLFIKELHILCKEKHNILTLSKEDIVLRYNTNVPIIENRMEMEKLYLNLLREHNARDIDFGSTEIGPHRDDLLIDINNKDLKIYGSQGQQRTTILSLKLAEVELIKKEKGVYPVVLLDDVFSELDEERRNYLIKSFSQMQTFITVTDAVDIKSIDKLDKSIYYIENGKLEERI